jgi:hypothetical protein
VTLERDDSGLVFVTLGQVRAAQLAAPASKITGRPVPRRVKVIAHAKTGAEWAAERRGAAVVE